MRYNVTQVNNNNVILLLQNTLYAFCIYAFMFYSFHIVIHIKDLESFIFHEPYHFLIIRPTTYLTYFNLFLTFLYH